MRSNKALEIIALLLEGAASRKIKISTILSFLLVSVLSSCVYSQTHILDSNLNVARCLAKHSISLPLSLLIPAGIREGYDMREFIASPEFGAFDSVTAPPDVLNEIYYSAIEYAHGNLELALLASAFGSFEHEYIPIGVLGLTVRIPLTSENHEQFGVRWSHLPAHIYRTQEGDRDKLQHFFASAWLKEWLGMDWLVQGAGAMVEILENMFVIGGFEDPRDLHANNDGMHFAIRAESDIKYQPSHALTPNPLK